MGFSISWIGFKGLTKANALRRLGLIDTQILDEVNEAPFSAAELPTGWVILYSHDFEFGTADHLYGLSERTMVVACQAEEHIMFSAAHCNQDGRHLWSIRHGNHPGVYDLSIEGTPPVEFAEISKRLIAEQRNEKPGGQFRVDHIFDVPVELAAALTGYRHDSGRFDWGQPVFTVVERHK